LLRPLLLLLSPKINYQDPLRLLLYPRLLALAFSIDGDGDVQTHDGPVDKVKLTAVSATCWDQMLGSTGRNPEK